MRLEPNHCPECSSTKLGAIERILITCGLEFFAGDETYDFDDNGGSVHWDTATPIKNPLDSDQIALSCSLCGHEFFATLKEI